MLLWIFPFWKMFQLALFSGASLNYQGSQIINSCSEPQRYKSTEHTNVPQMSIWHSIVFSSRFHLYSHFSNYDTFTNVFLIWVLDTVRKRWYISQKETVWWHGTYHRLEIGVCSWLFFVYFWQCNLVTKTWNQSLDVLFSFYCQFVIPYFPWKILTVSST